MKKTVTKGTSKKVATKKEIKYPTFNIDTLKKNKTSSLLKWMDKNAIVTGKKVDVLKILKKVRG